MSSRHSPLLARELPRARGGTSRVGGSLVPGGKSVVEWAGIFGSGDRLWVLPDPHGRGATMEMTRSDRNGTLPVSVGPAPVRRARTTADGHAGGDPGDGRGQAGPADRPDLSDRRTRVRDLLLHHGA